MLFLLLLLGITSATAAVFYYKNQKLELKLANLRERTTEEISRVKEDAANIAVKSENLLKQKIAEFDADAQRVREHYETESRKIIESIHSELVNALAELEPLRALSSLQQSETEVQAMLSNALVEAAALRAEASALLEQSRQHAIEERKLGQQHAKNLYQQAESLLTQSTREAGRIIAEAEARALQIGGDAYVALRDKEMLEQAIKAMHNVIEGYGDRYIIPTHSLLDELASDFGHTSAGASLHAARAHSRRMVEQQQAAECDYTEPNRRETAIRFVIDAFNGRVDAILSRVKHDNFGTLSQEIHDAFSLVNLNGEAFRNARILSAYRDARIAELRWAVVAHELKLREREEQRRIQEQIREEEKARRDYERAIQETAKEEEAILKAMEKARAEVATASAEERSQLEAKLAELNQKLAEAEAKNQRALSMAQQTRSGHVYIISNVGSFGDDVLKIGMTRRLEPDDRIKELGDASVPFSFDVHAMIRCDDAPALERKLHGEFDAFRVNKVNYRKEFFRVPIHKLREFVSEQNLEASFTMAAEAREFRETQAFEKMTPEEQLKYHLNESDIEVGED